MIARIATQAELEETCSWYAGHGERAPALDWFGRGFWVPHVAACFIYLTDGPRAYIEDIVTNPAASSEERHAAWLDLEAFVCAYAREHGCLYLVGWSKEASVANRAASSGFIDIGQFHGFARRLE